MRLRYVQNPKYRRGLPPGEAARLAAPLRNARLQPRKAEPALCAPWLLLENYAHRGGPSTLMPASSPFQTRPTPNADMRYACPETLRCLFISALIKNRKHTSAVLCRCHTLWYATLHMLKARRLLSRMLCPGMLMRRKRVCAMHTILQCMALEPLDVTTNRSTIPAVHDECLKFRQAWQAQEEGRAPGRDSRRCGRGGGGRSAGDVQARARKAAGVGRPL